LREGGVVGIVGVVIGAGCKYEGGIGWCAYVDIF
jgi:hypothetical protein